MDEETIIKKRLSIDEKVLKRLSKRAITIVNSFESLPEDQRDHQLQLLCGEIYQYQLNLKKVGKMVKVCEDEINYYVDHQKEISDEIAREHDEVERLKIVLQQEKQTVLNKKEYDRLAENISKYPSRSEQTRVIESFDEEAASLHERQAEVQKLINEYKKDVALIFTSLNNTIEKLSEEIKSRSK